MMGPRLLSFSLLTLVCTSPIHSLGAELSFAGIFTDGAVLQRDMEVPVWGFAESGEKIVVTFAGNSFETTTGETGRWTVKLPPMSASDSPRVLSAKGSQEREVTITDILVGEVWLCAGQSNMAMPVHRANDAEAEMAASDLPNLRVFTITRATSLEPVDDCAGEWITSTPDSAGRFSATAFFYGRELHREVGVPVGLIVAAWSGSAIEAWTSRDVQESQSGLQPLLKSWAEKDAAYTPEIAAAEKTDYEVEFADWKAIRAAAIEAEEEPPRPPRRPINPREHHHHPAVLYNGMIAPIIPYALRGAIWYQGETNGLTSEAAALYRIQLPLLVNDWRSRWGQGDFPMAWMQLPFVNARQVDWAPVREAMRLAHQDLPDTGMGVTLDLGEERRLHPTNKQAFAHRLALWARAEVYSEEIVWSGPLPKSHRFGKEKVAVDFDHAESGLKAKDSEHLVGFEICDADGGWHPAKAGIKKGTVIAFSPGVSNPGGIRYAWGNHPENNLVNNDGLPASPFLIQNKAKVRTAAKSTTPPPTKPPLVPVDIAESPDGIEQLDIFLLIGQSNMKGRGVMPDEPLRDPQIVMMHKGTDRWFLARHPLHLVGDPETFEGHDNAGVGSGLAFAQSVAEARPGSRIALVPCAVGGTAISKWAKGQRLYEDAIRRAKLALENGPAGKCRIAGVLWLQGESDSREERIGVYPAKLAALVDNIRADLGIGNLPFIASTIGEMKDSVEMRKAINGILLDLPNHRENTAAVDARDLNGHIGDSVHFDTATQNEIGRRFAAKWLEMDGEE